MYVTQYFMLEDKPFTFVVYTYYIVVMIKTLSVVCANSHCLSTHVQCTNNVHVAACFVVLKEYCM